MRNLNDILDDEEYKKRSKKSFNRYKIIAGIVIVFLSVIWPLILNACCN